LAELRKKVETLPEGTDDERVKKEQLHRELCLEYLDNILGEIEKMQAGLARKAQDSKKGKLTSRGK
jgi:hypothetical protein